MALSWEDRLKSLFVPGWLYYQRKLKSESRKGEPEIRLLPHLLPSGGQTAIDVGANRGIYSYLLSGLFDHVLSFEPNPDLASFGRHMLPTKVEVVQAALGAEEGRGTLRIPTGKSGRENHLTASLSPSVLASVPVARTISVHVRTLDSYGAEGVGFIKVDVEGTELQVIDGARRTIARDKPLLMVEILAGFYENPLGIVERICSEHGYRSQILTDDGLVDAIPHLQAELPVISRNVLFFPDK